MAATTVIHEKCARFGTDSTTSTGIMNFDTRSMPFSTPAKMIVSVSAANTAKQTSAETPLEINAEK